MNSENGNELKSIFHDPSYYAKAFDEYAKLSSKYQVLATWADTVFPREIVETLATNIPDHEQPLRILGVGSGTGKMDCRMIDKLLTRFPLIHNTVLEPAKDHINTYKELAKTKGYAGIDWEWYKQTWDEFIKGRKTSDRSGGKKFHFISAIHCLYYVDDLETALVDMMECLEDGGVIMLIMVADHSGFSHLWQRFRTTVSDEMFTPFNAGSVREILKKRGFEFGIIPQKSSVDITSCFEEGNKVGMMVTDFLIHVIDLHQIASPQFVEEVMTYLGGPECSVRNGDKVAFNNDWEAILVKKTKIGNK